MPRLNLTDASAIVTGGASGIGEASARQLAALGAKIVIADLNEDLGKKVADGVTYGYRGGTKSDLPAEIQNVNIPDRTSVDFQNICLHGLSIMCRNHYNARELAGKWAGRSGCMRTAWWLRLSRL